MKKKSMLIVVFCMFMVPFFVADEAEAVGGGWAVCNVVRVGSNAVHGFAYLELTAAGPNAGLFSNINFQIDESIRNEGMATALTSLSLGEYVRVLITTDVNPNGYQIIKAVYTYVP